MLKTLIKTQFLSCFRSYFVNPKTGKVRSRGKIVGMFILFAFLLLYLVGVFFSIGFLLGMPLFEIEMDWLYLSLMSLLAVMLGVFGSVFNTYASMYLAKDNELLLSMPIPVSSILISRISLVFGLSMLYSGLVWIPTLLFYWIFGTPSFMGVVGGILMFLLITLFVTVLTCALGYLVALFSKKVKGKSIFIVLLCVVFFVLYYIVCFRASELLQELVANAVAVGASFKKWGNILYLFGQAAAGDIVSLLLTILIVAALTALCLWLLSRSFIKIVTTSNAVSKVEYKADKAVKTQSAKKALFNRELKRFIASPTYMLNGGLGVFFLPVLAALVVIYRTMILEVVSELALEVPFLGNSLMIVLLGPVFFMLSMNMITAPSISLEGKNLWILKSMPVSAQEILGAKMNLHVSVNAYIAMICTSVAGLVLKQDISIVTFAVVIVYLFVYVTGAIGLIMGLKNPNFNWTNESMVVKQGMHILVTLLINLVISLVLIASYFILANFFNYDIQIHLGAVLVILVLAAKLLQKWMNTKGAQIFNKL